MLLGWPRRLSAKALPDKVRQTLISRFRLDDDQTTRLRCMEKRGHFAGRQVRFLRVLIRPSYPAAPKNSHRPLMTWVPTGKRCFSKGR